MPKSLGSFESFILYTQNMVAIKKSTSHNSSHIMVSNIPQGISHSKQREYCNISDRVCLLKHMLGASWGIRLKSKGWDFVTQLQNLATKLPLKLNHLVLKFSIKLLSNHTKNTAPVYWYHSFHYYLWTTNIPWRTIKRSMKLLLSQWWRIYQLSSNNTSWSL